VPDHQHVRLRRGLPLLLIAAGLLMPAVASARGITISRSGAIGPLRLNVSSVADIVQRWGQSAYETTGNVLGGASSGYPNYDLLGYRCGRRSGYTACAVNFYVSQKTRRLESFETTAPQFLLFGGVHVGMSADLAAKREHQPDEDGCGQGVRVSTPWLSVNINTRGGASHVRRNAIYILGGRVVSIAIDYKHYGVGVLFC
jgi:hypothetical protein